MSTSVSSLIASSATVKPSVDLKRANISCIDPKSISFIFAFARRVYPHLNPLANLSRKSLAIETLLGSANGFPFICLRLIPPPIILFAKVSYSNFCKSAI